MERREMLAASFRSLAQALPALLRTVGSLALILDHKTWPPKSLGAACFPGKMAGPPEQASKPSSKED